MKKKFLSFIFAICLIMPCAFIFSACKSTLDDASKLTISVNSEITNGSIYLNKSVAESGDTINVMPVPDEGYELEAGSLKYNNTEIIDNSFVMPNENVVITAKFVQSQVVPAEDLFSIEIDNSIEHGTITASKTSAKAGEKITLNILSDEGYKLNESSLQYGAYGNPVAIHTTFVMPSENIRIRALFEKIKYSISYDIDEFTTNTNPKTYSIGDVVELADPIKNGYEFNGWYIWNLTDGNEISEISGLKNDLVLIPSWEKIFDLNGDAVSLSVYGKTLTEITIPETIDGQIITSIDSYGFENSKLTEFTVPDHITEIGDNAFTRNTNLETVNIHKDVSKIGESIFSWCDKLKEINIADNNSYYKTDVNKTYIIEKHISGLNKIVAASNKASQIQDVSVSIIGENAFLGCSKLTEVQISNRVKIIENYAFYRCENLTSITIPDSVVYLGNGILRNCDKIEKVSVPFIGDTVSNSLDRSFGYLFGSGEVGVSNNIPETLTTLIITSDTSINSDDFAGGYGNISKIFIKEDCVEDIGVISIPNFTKQATSEMVGYYMFAVNISE